MGRECAAASLLEPIPAVEIHFDGLADVIVSGGRVWFLLYANRPSLDDHDVMERILVARCDAPVEVVPGCVQQTIVALGRRFICGTCEAPVGGEKFKLAS